MAATSVFAADFHTGQAARMIIGQPTFTAQHYDTSESMPTPPEKILGAVGGVAYGGGVLAVADANRLGAMVMYPRVLLYKDVAQWPTPTQEIPFVDGTRCAICVGTASVILGQVETIDNKQQYTIGLSDKAFRLPTAVATDGTHLVVADTDNNRVLIWNTLPTSAGQPADVVLGQPDFNSNCPNAIGPRNSAGVCEGDVNVPSARSLRAPQGVWISGNKLFVADEQNNRILIWNEIPTQNFAEANLVLGAPDFKTFVEPDLTKKDPTITASNMLSPVSVTSDGQRVFVSDLGHNRVLIWNSMPAQNNQPADVAVGQPDLTSAVANNSPALCDSNGTDDNGKPTYPSMCAATLDFPRFALSDGERLYIADGGNDRVLVFNRIPQQSGARADAILGQVDEFQNQTSDASVIIGENIGVVRRSAADSIRTPTALAWDGTNLYVADPFDRRVMVFTPAPKELPRTGIRNAASLGVYAIGTIEIGGDIQADDKINFSVGGTDYTYTVKSGDTLTSIVNSMAALVNAGEGNPAVIATVNEALNRVVLTARVSGPDGNNIPLSASVPTTAPKITATASSNYLKGGYDAARIAPGTLISIFGDSLADLPDGEVVSAPSGQDPLPRELAGVQVYIDGLQAPLLAVTKYQINAQVPWEVIDSTSSNLYVRTRHSDGSVTVTAPYAMPIVPANPGIFGFWGSGEPRPGIALHGSSHATGAIYIEGLPKAGDQVTVTINGRNYSYTVSASEVSETDSYPARLAFRDHLIEQINASDPEVYALPAGQFVRILLRAIKPGPEGEGIPFSASSQGDVMAGTLGGKVLTDQSGNATGVVLCCSNIEGALITPDNPAVPGENIIVYATGLGMIKPQEAAWEVMTGFTYKGPAENSAITRMDSMAGGSTADVLYMGMKPWTVGLYEVHLQLNNGLPTNPQTQVNIEQDIFVSNVVTIPVVKPQ